MPQAAKDLVPEITPFDEILFSRISEEFLKTGEMPDVSTLQKELGPQADLLAGSPRIYPKPQSKIVIHCHANAFLGYGQLAMLTVRALRTQDAVCVVRPVDTIVDPQACPCPIDRKEAEEDWELLIGPPTLRPTRGKTTIFYTMWEGGRLPPDCVYNVNEAAFCIVPTEWNATVFNASGVEIPIYVVEPGIDTERYAPDPLVPGEILVHPFWEAYFTNPVTVFGTGGTDYRVPRKGISAVVEAFRKAFPDESDVCLRIKTASQDPLPPALADPRIDFVNEWWSDALMAEWYRSLHCYVSGSPAEGFGLFPVHALCCGVPVIATFAHSHAAYLNDAIAYSVDYELRESEPRGWDNPYRGGLWYWPKVESLAARMREIYENRNDLQLKADVLRAAKSERFSLLEYGKRLTVALERCGMYNRFARPKPKKIRKKASEGTAKVKDVCVIGPGEEGCGVGQYGRQVAEVLGCAYLPFLCDDAPISEKVILQYHPFYWHDEAVKIFIQQLCKTRRVLLDIHHPNRIAEVPDTYHAIYHCHAFYPDIDRRSVYWPLMSPILRDAGEAVAKLATKVKIGWHGLWQPHKGVDVLIESIARLREMGIDAGLIAVGGVHEIDVSSKARSFVYWEKCNREVASRGLRNVIAMSNRMVSYADVHATLSTCDAYCLPYMTDEAGQSSAIAFGFALGLPVAVSDRAIFADQRDSAWLLPEGAERLARSLADLLSDPSKMRHYQTRAELAYARCAPRACKGIYEELLR